MIQHLYLPALQKDKSPKIPAETGLWDTNTSRLLLSVSEGIVVDEKARVRGVSSVPDLWARPLTFASALRLQSHPLRARLVQEWRGLLSLIALARVHGYPIDIVPVALDGGRFTVALRNLAPRPVQLERQQPYPWTDLLLVRYDGIPIGALSPATFVYTGTDYQLNPEWLKTSLNLKDASGFLKPPEERFEQLYIAEWVWSLRQRLTDREAPVLNPDENNPDVEVVRLLNTLLSEWITDLSATLGIPANRPPDSPDVEIDDDPLPVDQGAGLLRTHRVYRELLRPLRREGSREAATKTDLGLTWKRNLTGYREVVTITGDLIAGGGRIWDMKRLSHLGGDADAAVKKYFQAPEGEAIDGEDLKKHAAIWIRPESYFLTDVLLKAAGGAEFTAGAEKAVNGDPRFVLPFRKQILDFFSSDDLQDLKPSFTRESDDSIVFTFFLPVGNGMQKQKIEKTYRSKNPGPRDGAIREVSVPVVELFPNYIDSSWRRYYVFQSGAGQFSVNPIVTAAVSGPAVSRVHQNTATGDKVRITATTADTVWESDRPIRLPFPEALEFCSPDSKSALGLLLLARPKEPEGGRSGLWRIGIDFGTSNTNVWVDEGGDRNARQWQFKFAKHIRRVTTAATTDPARADALFLPSDVVELPIPTILRIHMEPQREHPILDHFPYLSDKPGNYSLPRTVHSNIKWEDEDRKTRYFLESVLLLLLVETAQERVAKVKLACSYPKAFSADKLGNFQGDWAEVIKNLIEGPNRVCDSSSTEGAIRDARAVPRVDGGPTPMPSFKLELEKVSELPSFEVEGEAAGQYFGNEKAIGSFDHKADTANGAICLDVGGGTTDISIWFKNDIVFDASIMLAGRQISDLLAKRPRIQELLFSDTAAAALYEHRENPVQFAARLNIILREQEAAIQERLNKHANVPELRAFRRLLVFEFGAIAFYASTVLAAADRFATKGELLRKLSGSAITFHWGGNAAKFVNWIDFGRPSDDGPSSKMLNAIAFQVFKEAGATVPGDELRQLQSPRHKSEAAGGLAVMALGRSRNRARSDFEMDDASTGALKAAQGLVCGENIELTSGPVNYLATVSEKDLFQESRTLFVKTSLERLKRFVDIMNYFGVQFGIFNNDAKLDFERYRTRIANSTRGFFVIEETKREGSRTIEPLFILEVKLLLKILAESVVD